MNNFAYVITEGVIDVCFLKEVLRSGFGLKQIQTEEKLPEAARTWLERFSWPVRGNIVRLSVPAPIFMTDLAGQLLVGLRNAAGLSEIQKQIDVDHESFALQNWRPVAAAVILDLDTEPPASRFSNFASVLAKAGYPHPTKLDQVIEKDGRRAGVFGLPGTGKPGTLEDILLPLGKVRFPALSLHASKFIESWKLRTDATDPPHEDLSKPAGYKKAEVAAMTALLKPGRTAVASIEDDGWVPKKPDEQPLLVPLMNFLGSVIASRKVI